MAEESPSITLLGLGAGAGPHPAWPHRERPGRNIFATATVLAAAGHFQATGLCAAKQAASHIPTLGCSSHGCLPPRLASQGEIHPGTARVSSLKTSLHTEWRSLRTWSVHTGQPCTPWLPALLDLRFPRETRPSMLPGLQTQIPLGSNPFCAQFGDFWDITLPMCNSSHRLPAPQCLHRH